MSKGAVLAARLSAICATVRAVEMLRLVAPTSSYRAAVGPLDSGMSTDVFSTRSSGIRPTAEWLALLAEAGVPSGKVRTLDEVYTWEQTLSQGLLVDVDHPTLGTVQLPGPPLRLETM